MQFVWVTPQWVRCSVGFELKSIDRYRVQYASSEGTLTLKVEDGYTKDWQPCVTVAKTSFSHWDSGVDIPEEKQEELMRRVAAAFEFQEIELILDPS